MNNKLWRRTSKDSLNTFIMMVFFNPCSYISTIKSFRLEIRLNNIWNRSIQSTYLTEITTWTLLPQASKNDMNDVTMATSSWISIKSKRTTSKSLSTWILSIRSENGIRETKPTLSTVCGRMNPLQTTCPITSLH